ncbi:ImmA/IrrE family metallo-endopeptidase [Mycobacterium sp. 236(2023)]|uniref:ImmA/IrrE family metallo-endopeptidase n=1 Tax=Mycobacterium sp. 236(2023) TaxID=3038163 RepID=UPI002414F0B3|nr:ImmA/IrrE family metallo-endopeptidase [Mycobacterium sp. 236(2023)]MDG4668618.1 ImmA/IrrE family metallo-endopeptidase [Mycobacterium sp. 236(2023)]
MTNNACESINDCVERAISSVSEDVRVRFAAEPSAVLTADFGMTLRQVDHLTSSRTGGGACDGLSFMEDGVIIYAPTPYSRREQFTLAHELGHWLVENSPDSIDWIADQEDPGRLLETVCDRIAQHMLLPDPVSQAVVGAGPIKASHLFELFEVSQASRPVCAIALANYIPGLGAIAIIDRGTAVVTHASVNPDPIRGWPTVFPWRGQVLPGRHPLLRLAPGSSLSRRLTWSTPWDAQAEFYVDAASDTKRIVAVLSDSDLWQIEQFHPGLDHEFDYRPTREGYCCGSSFQRRGYPCSNCNAAFCPQCGECRCERNAKREFLCAGSCFMKYLPHLLVDGLCADCRL